MNLSEALIPLLPKASGVIAFVGAGGKTSALFRLAQELEAKGRSVLVTTTTHLADPRAEPGPFVEHLILRPEMELPCPATLSAEVDFPQAMPSPPSSDEEGVRGRLTPASSELTSVSRGALTPPAPSLQKRVCITVLASREADAPGKVKGIHPSWVPTLKLEWDFVLVEADGSRRLPVKAPASYEPVIPADTDLVVGVIGLDCLGRSMDGETVHRPELFARVTGCAPGAPIAWKHLAELIRHPEGLFKGAVRSRVVLLNKADRAPFLPTREQCSELATDLVLLCSLQNHESVVSSFPREVPECL